MHTPPSHRVGNAGGQDLLKQLEANRVVRGLGANRRKQRYKHHLFKHHLFMPVAISNIKLQCTDWAVTEVAVAST